MKISTISIARWMVLAGTAGFLVLVALASWALRDQIYQTFQDPGEPFQTYTPPEGADYASAEGWFTRGAFSGDDEPAVFFLHPTTYSGGSNWNAQLDKDSAVEAVTRTMLPNYAAPFAHAGVLFAPKYRQAALYTFMNNREDSILAREFAYRDAERAFDAFLTQIGDDRRSFLPASARAGFTFSAC